MALTQIGDYTIDRVVELECAPFSARELFPDLTPEMLERCRAEVPRGNITDDNMLVLSFHCYVLRTGRHDHDRYVLRQPQGAPGTADVPPAQHEFHEHARRSRGEA